MLMNHTATLTHTPLPIKVMEKREEVDWRRHGVFCTFGLFYLVRFWESLCCVCVFGFWGFVGLGRPPRCSRACDSAAACVASQAAQALP